MVIATVSAEYGRATRRAVVVAAETVKLRQLLVMAVVGMVVAGCGGDSDARTAARDEPDRAAQKRDAQPTTPSQRV